MSMTREEASEHLFDDWYIENGRLCVDESNRDDFCKALGVGIKALRPISREQVEKVWPECDCCEIPCDNCKSAYKWDTHGLADECVVCRKSEYKNYTPESQFCEFCGRPLTNEAVQIVMERLEALHETI